VRKKILVANCLQGVSAGCSSFHGSATNGVAQLRQGGVLFNKTASAARELFAVRRSALDQCAQRLRLIRTCKTDSALDTRLMLPMIFEWGVSGISSVCGSAMSISPAFEP